MSISMLSDGGKIVNRVTLFSIISLLLVSNIVFFSHQQNAQESASNEEELHKSEYVRHQKRSVVKNTKYNSKITRGTQQTTHSEYILISGSTVPPHRNADFYGSLSYSYSYDFSFSYDATEPPAMKTNAALCLDVPDWKDSQGMDCELYSKWNLCTKSGDYGLGYIYDPVIVPFSAWSREGVDATQACCACGGGAVTDFECSDSMCLACTESDFCTSCVEGYYIDSEQGCSACTDHNCLSCDDQNTCTSCDAGFYVDSSNKCSSCTLAIPGCMYCSDASTCADCKWGSYATPEGVCASCQDAIPNCIFCADSQTCTLCDSGYNVDPFYQCSEIETPCDRHCYDGYCDINTGRCTRCLENYAPTQNGACKRQEELGCDPNCNDCRQTCTKKNGVEVCSYICHNCEHGHKLSSEKVCIQDQDHSDLCIWFHKNGDVCNVNMSGAQDSCSACRSKLSNDCHHFTWDGVEECKETFQLQKANKMQNLKHKLANIQLEDSLIYIHSKLAALFSSTSAGTLVLLGTLPVFLVSMVFFLRSQRGNELWHALQGYQSIP